MKQVIAFVFRLINFAVLITVFYYLFKKYLLPTIQQSISDKKQHIQNLIDQQEVLEINQQEMDTILMQQAQLCANLKEQISQWRGRVELELAQRMQAKKELEEKLERLAHRKSDWLKQESIRKRVFPKAIAQARNDLYKKFSNEQHAKTFLDKILVGMKKDKS